MENEPLTPKKSAVRQYQIRRPVADPDHITIDPEPEARKETEALLAEIRLIWGRIESTILSDPKVHQIKPIKP